MKAKHETYFKVKLILILLLSVIILQYSYSQKISESVRVYSGAVNGVFIEKNGKYLVVYGDPEGGIKKAEMALFTHFRRDVIWAGRSLVQNGAVAVVPAGEKSYFIKGDSIWTRFQQARFHDYYCQTTMIGISPLNVNRFVQGGEILKWQNTDIKVLNTPGYTRGSVSYIVDIDNKKYAFTGDLIYGDGKIFDLYSFQDSLKDILPYHGYAVRLGQLVSSLQLIAAQKPDIIIPARGPVIKDPEASIQRLIQRIRLVYKNYLSISAYRWYYQDRTNIMYNHVLGKPAFYDWMPLASIEKNPPSWYYHFSNSNLVFAKDSSAFLIDCGTKAAFDQLVKMKKSGQLKSLDGIFITHYHDDHTDFINDVVKEFNCPVYVTKELKDILENPSAYHMPCLTTHPIPDLTVVRDGQKMYWKDYTLTFHYFPGQTLYHDAVLFEEKNGKAVFFAGDSFTPSGVDDYCLLNRNLLHSGTGYFYCINLLKNLPDKVLLSNQHVAPLFAFSRQQLDNMEYILTERKALLKDLFPWDNLNYGIDEQWVTVYPYGLTLKPGQSVDFSVKIFNHSEVKKTFQIEPNVPAGFNVEPRNNSIVLESLNEGEIKFKLRAPEQIIPGVRLLTVNAKFDHWNLREWSEALIEISP